MSTTHAAGACSGNTRAHTPGHGLPHMHTLALIWHLQHTHVVTAWGTGNSFKGMLIFQMLLDINKPPNWRAEIQFERSSPWRYRDVYPSLSISLVPSYDKGFLFDYHLSCGQQRGHGVENSSWKTNSFVIRAHKKCSAHRDFSKTRQTLPTCPGRVKCRFGLINAPNYLFSLAGSEKLFNAPYHLDTWKWERHYWRKRCYFSGHRGQTTLANTV